MPRFLPLALLVLAACSGGSGNPASPPVPTPTPVPENLAAPAVTSPAMGAVVEQNDPATGCSFDPRIGYGNRIAFAWQPSAQASGVRSYQLYVKKATASLPIVDVTVSATTHVRTDCTSFVADANLEGWEVRVRAVGASGAMGPWSEAVTYSYSPCMLDRRRHCG